MRTHLVEPGRTVHDSRLYRGSIVARVGRVLDYLFGLVYVLLLVRLALEFFGARTQTGFVLFIHSVTDPLYAPFKGIFATTNVQGEHVVWALIVAVLAYMLLHAAIRGLLQLVARD
jgi:uncharacterized protein YggT (Ycf19 family)